MRKMPRPTRRSGHADPVAAVISPATTIARFAATSFRADLWARRLALRAARPQPPADVPLGKPTDPSMIGPTKMRMRTRVSSKKRLRPSSRSPQAEPAVPLSIRLRGYRPALVRTEWGPGLAALHDGEVSHPMGSITVVWIITPAMNHTAYPMANRTLAFMGPPLMQG
jgi:hypothetical protein